MAKKSKIFTLFRELMIVFVGVLAAFVLNDYWSDRITQKDINSTYKVIYEDLDRYYESGKVENSNGFVKLFQSCVENSKLFVEQKKLPRNGEIFGDYWNIELINSMLLSGKLNDIDSDIFKKVARLHTVHSNMLRSIEEFNYFYYEKIVPNLDNKNVNFFDANGLKIEYQRFMDYQNTILSLSQATVGMAESLKFEIKTNYLE